MPIVLNDISSRNFRIMAWNIDETEEQLKKFSQEQEILIVDMSEISHPQRRKQKLAAAIMVNMISEKVITYGYTDLGKPVLENHHGHISVSHSGNYVAVIYHESKITGIDIEKPLARILRLSEKFVNDIEHGWLEKENIHSNSLIWGVKESVFKAIDGGGIDFKKNIIVSEPYEKDISEGKGMVKFIKEENLLHFQYHFRYLEDYLLVFTIAEN